MPKMIPHNLVAEQSVIGSMLLSKNAIQKASDVLAMNSFYDAKNGLIFQAIVNLYDKKTPIDLTTLTAELDQTKKLNEVGNVEYLTELLNIVPTAGNVDYYIKIVKDNQMLRSVINASEEIASLVYNSDREVSDIMDTVEGKIVNLIKNRESGEFLTIQEALGSFQEKLEKLAASKGEISGIPTGWYGLDRLTSGLHENQLIIIAARPGLGKTAFALNLATNVAIHTSKTVAFFSLEMGSDELASRIVASVGQIDGNKLRNGSLLNNDWKRVTEARSQLAGAQLFISDDASTTVAEIKSKCRRLATSDQGLDLVIIDYLQLLTMGSGNYGENRLAEVSDMTRTLKKLAKELNITIVALSQLSRAVEKRDDKRPKMSDLRDSGTIEQDADIVAMLHRNDYNVPVSEQTDPSESELIIAKQRSGSTGTINLLFRKSTSTFVNGVQNQNNESSNQNTTLGSE